MTDSSDPALYKPPPGDEPPPDAEWLDDAWHLVLAEGQNITLPTWTRRYRELDGHEECCNHHRFTYVLAELKE